MVSLVQWGYIARLSASCCQPQSPGPKLTAGIQKKTAKSALIFSGKGDERIKTSTVQSKMERHKQLIRRLGMMLKCTCGNLWREYFFWISCLLCKYMELIQCWFVRIWTIAPEEYSWQKFQIQLLWAVPLVPLKAAGTGVSWVEGTHEMKKTFAWEMVEIWEKRLLQSNKSEFCRIVGMRQTQAEKVQQNTANNSPYKAFISLKSSLELLFKLNNIAICWGNQLRVPVFPFWSSWDIMKTGRC